MRAKITDFLHFIENQETGKKYYRDSSIYFKLDKEIEESIGHIAVYRVKGIYVVEDFYIDFTKIDYWLNTIFFETREEVNNYIQKAKDSLL